MDPEKLIERTREVYKELYTVMSEWQEHVGEKDMYRAVDHGFALKKAAEMLDDLRKEANKLRAIYEKIANAYWLVKWQGRKKTQPIRTEMVTASVKHKINAVLPTLKRDHDDYVALARWIGIPEEEIESSTVVIHWKYMMDRLTALTEQGKPLPPGIDSSRTFIEYTMVYREKKKNGD